MRRHVALLSLLVLVTVLIAGSALGQTAGDGATAVEVIGVTVSDLDRSLDFYTHVLPFQVVGEYEAVGSGVEHLTGVFGARVRIALLRLGDEYLELTDYLAPASRPIPVDSRSNDLWFQHVALIVSDMDAAYALLRAHGVEHASTGPQRLPDWNPNAGGIKAFYFKDPDEHVLEILQFPPGKGDPKWHRPSDRLFLGIDHTAIVVANTESSLEFYRDRLGMTVAGGSENYGTEQEHLNNVFGARLRITTLRTPQGPGVELLEYLAPRDGRPFPPDTRSTDLWHWQTRIQVNGIQTLTDRLLEDGVSFVSPGDVDVSGAGLGFGLGALLRDPDGHAVELVGETVP